MATRLVIVDDHPVVLQGLQDMFAPHKDIATVACCSSGSKALDAVDRLAPDVLVLDLKMSGLTGLDVLRRLRDTRASCRTVVLTAAATDEELAEALDLGAAGFVLKDAPTASVIEGVRQVAQYRFWLDRETLARAQVAGRRRRQAAAAAETTLTPRELEVIQLVADGHRNKAIAAQLGMAEGTVKVHLHNIYDKLGVKGRLEMVLAAQNKSLI